jgi:hypothetical protein
MHPQTVPGVAWGASLPYVVDNDIRCSRRFRQTFFNVYHRLAGINSNYTPNPLKSRIAGNFHHNGTLYLVETSIFPD